MHQSSRENIAVNEISRPRFHVGLHALVLAIAVGLLGCNQSPGQAPASQVQTTATVTEPAAAAKLDSFTMTAAGLPQADGTRVQLSGLLPGADGEWHDGVVAQGTIKGGSFTLAGTAKAPVRGRLQLGAPNGKDLVSVSLILEPASYRVSNVDGVLLVEGGRYNDQVYGYMRLPAYLAAVQAQDKAEQQAFKGVDHNDEKAMLQAKIRAAPTMGPYYMAVGKIAGDYLAGIIDGQGDDLLKFFALSANPDGDRYPPEKRRAMQAAWGQSLANSPAYQSELAVDKLEAQAAATRDALVVGKPYRDITVADKDGHEVKLSDVLKQNKFVLLDFWASWCAPCREEFPYLAKVYRDYHVAGFEIYGVSLDEERGDWLKAMQQESDNGHLPWINLRAEGFASKAADAYGVRGLPNNFLISSDGTIVGKDMRGNDVERVVAKQLKKLGKS